MKTTFPTGLGPKWKIQKQELYPGHPEPWTAIPPAEDYNNFLYDITTYKTGEQALAAFAAGGRQL